MSALRLEQLTAGYRQMGLSPMADYLASVADQPLTMDDRILTAFDQALTWLRNARAGRHVERVTRTTRAVVAAELPAVKTGSAHGITKAQLTRLASCDWIRAGASVVFTGDTQSGKTFIASALIKQAAKERMTGQARRFIRVSRLDLTRWLEEHEKVPLRDGLPVGTEKLMAADLLVLDNFAQRSVSVDQAALLLRVLDERLEPRRRSMLVLSPLSQKEWLEAFDCKLLGEAICKRLTTAETLHLRAP